MNYLLQFSWNLPQLDVQKLSQNHIEPPLLSHLQCKMTLKQRNKNPHREAEFLLQKYE